MSLNPSDYRWTICVHGYEPIPTLDRTAPEEFLNITCCNCHGDYNNRRCSYKKNGVTCISTCGVCKGITCKNCSHDVGESEDDMDNDCWTFWHCEWEINADYYICMWNKSYFVCKWKSECGVFPQRSVSGEILMLTINSESRKTQIWPIQKKNSTNFFSGFPSWVEPQHFSTWYHTPLQTNFVNTTSHARTLLEIISGTETK